MTNDKNNLEKKEQRREDGWSNVFKGLGVSGVDGSVNNRFRTENIISFEAMFEIYQSNGLGARIVDIPANEATKNWITVENDPDKETEKYLRSLSTRKITNRALSWARLTGGSLIVMGIDDGFDFDEPVNENSIKSIVSLLDYDLTDIFVNSSDFYTEGPKKNQIEFYHVIPKNGGSSFPVHETRVMRFDGDKLPNRLARAYDAACWGNPVLQRVYDSLSKLGMSYVSINNIMQEFVVGKMTIDDLKSLIVNGQEKVILKRMSIIDLCKSHVKTILLDKEEDYSRESLNVGGLEGLIDKMTINVSANSGIPVSKLFTRPPAGLNTTNETDRLDFQDEIKSFQEIEMIPELEKLNKYIQLADDGPRLENTSLKANPLTIMTQMEETGIRKIQADIDKIYIDTNVLDPAEVTMSRFGGEGYSQETKLMNDREMDLEQPDEDPEEDPEQPDEDPEEDPEQLEEDPEEDPEQLEEEEEEKE